MCANIFKSFKFYLHRPLAKAKQQANIVAVAVIVVIVVAEIQLIFFIIIVCWDYKHVWLLLPLSGQQLWAASMACSFRRDSIWLWGSSIRITVVVVVVVVVVVACRRYVVLVPTIDTIRGHGSCCSKLTRCRQVFPV